MTVPAQITYTTTTANGATTVFPFGFKIVDATDLGVTLDGVLTTAGFTISGIGVDLGGSITFTAPPANGVKVVCYLAPDLSRITDYQQFGDWMASQVNADFDRLWLALQSANQNNNRSIKLPVDTATDQVIDYDAATRANKLVGFDGSGNAALVLPTDLTAASIVTAYIATLLDDPDAVTARATLGLVIGILANQIVQRGTAGAIGVGTASPAKDVHVLSATGAGTLRLENGNTAVISGDKYGAFEFYGNDASVNASGVRAKIDSEATGSAGASVINLYATSTGTTTLTKALTVGSSSITPTVPFSGINLSGDLSLSWGMSGMKVLTMFNTDTLVDIDLTSYFQAAINTFEQLRISVVASYFNDATTPTFASCARFFKNFTQGIVYDGATFVKVGEVVDVTVYNSDAVNFPAGGVNANNALVVVSATQVLLRLKNRATPAANSQTNFYVYFETVGY